MSINDLPGEPFSTFALLLPAAAPISSSDRIVIVQGGFSRQIPAVQIIGSTSPTIPPAGATYLVLSTDTFVAITKNYANIVQLPSGPTFGQRTVIADCGGSAGSYPITIAAGAGDTIDGIAAYLLITNWQSVELQYVQALNLWKVM